MHIIIMLHIKILLMKSTILRSEEWVWLEQKPSIKLHEIFDFRSILKDDKFANCSIMHIIITLQIKIQLMKSTILRSGKVVLFACNCWIRLHEIFNFSTYFLKM